MKKLIPNNHYIKIIVTNYLRDNVQSPEKLKKIEQLLHTTKIDRMNIVNIYNVINRYDENNKFLHNIKTIDQKLQENFNRGASEDMFNLTMNVERLKVLIRYQLPYEQTVQNILENVLLDECTPSEILLLSSLLTVKSHFYSKKYKKLINNIFDLIRQSLENYPSSNFISSILNFTCKSQFKIPQLLLSRLQKKLDEFIHYYDYQALSKISNNIFQKSIRQMNFFGMMETNRFKKRIIYQIMMKKLSQEDIQHQLPGSSWKNSQELLQSTKCLKSISVKQPFLDIFPKIQIQRQNETYISLKNPEFFKQYFENIFVFIRIGYKRIDQMQLKRILQILKCLFVQNQRFFTAQFQKVLKRHNVNILKLFITLQQISGYIYVSHNETLRKQIYRYMFIVQKSLTESYLNSHNFLLYNFSDLNYLYKFMQKQLCYNLDAQEYQEKHVVFFDMKKIEHILNLQKQKKYIQNHYSQLLPFFRFVKVIISKKQQNKPSQIGTSYIIKSQKAKYQEIKEIMQINLQNGNNSIKISEDDLQKINKKYDIFKNLTLQPNLELSYLIAEKESKRIITIFDNKSDVVNKQSYSGQQRDIFGELQSQESELTVHSIWKKMFVKTYYKAQYIFCQSDLQFHYKFCKKLQLLL